MVVDLLIDHHYAKDAVRLARAYPELKIVINHCMRARMKDGGVSDEWRAAVAACGREPNVYCKLSSILNFADTKPFEETAPTELTHYLPVLDPCFEIGLSLGRFGLFLLESLEEPRVLSDKETILEGLARLSQTGRVRTLHAHVHLLQKSSLLRAISPPL